MRRIDRVRGALIINPLRPVCELQHGPRAVPGQQSRRRGPADCLSSLPRDKVGFSPVSSRADDCGLRKPELFVELPPRNRAAHDVIPLANKANGVQRVIIRLVSHRVVLLVCEMRHKENDVAFE